MIGEVDSELGLKLPAPEVSTDEIVMLVAVLKAAGEDHSEEGLKRAGWMTAREIVGRLGMRDCDSQERHVRKIASAAAPVVVSFPGSKGYKLWQLCSVGEILHCIEAFESQGRDMIKRAVIYRQAYHRRFRGAPEEHRA